MRKINIIIYIFVWIIILVLIGIGILNIFPMKKYIRNTLDCTLYYEGSSENDVNKLEAIDLFNDGGLNIHIYNMDSNMKDFVTYIHQTWIRCYLSYQFYNEIVYFIIKLILVGIKYINKVAIY